MSRIRPLPSPPIAPNFDHHHSPTVAVAANLHVPTTESDRHRVDLLAAAHGIHVELGAARGAQRDQAQINLLILEQRPQLIPAEHPGRVPNVVQRERRKPSEIGSATLACDLLCRSPGRGLVARRRVPVRRKGDEQRGRSTPPPPSKKLLQQGQPVEHAVQQSFFTNMQKTARLPGSRTGRCRERRKRGVITRCACCHDTAATPLRCRCCVRLCTRHASHTSWTHISCTQASMRDNNKDDRFGRIGRGTGFCNAPFVSSRCRQAIALLAECPLFGGASVWFDHPTLRVSMQNGE